MYFTIKALVLRVTSYNDTDALLTLLTHSHGKLTVKARGLKRKNSPLVAPCQLLAFGEFTLFEYRGMYTVNEAHSVELFQNLRKDLVKLSLGTYFAQVAEVICQEDTPNPQLLSLTLNCLYALSQLSLPEKLIKTAFEMRIACIAGYEPDLSGCHYCGAAQTALFDLSEGGFVCGNCGSRLADGIRMPLSAGVLDAMRYLCYCDLKKIFSFQIGEQTLELLCDLTESYLLTQLERGFSTLDFYKSLNI